MQLKAIIFDYGGVLCFHPTDRQVDETAALCRASREQFLNAYWANRAAYDRSEMDPVEYWRTIGNMLGETYSLEEIEEFRRRDVGFWVNLDERMMDWARRVRAAGFRTAILSNLPADLGRQLRNGMNLVNQFDHHSFSYELRSAKPDPEIYLHAVEGLEVRPEEALFLDDRPENIAGARAIGLHAIRFESPVRLKESLDELRHVAGSPVPVGTPPVLLE